LKAESTMRKADNQIAIGVQFKTYYLKLITYYL
jgi:hypothetical protein